MYVDFNLDSFRTSKMAGITGSTSRSFSSTSALVEYPVLVFFPCGRCIFSNSTSPNCLGDCKLNSSPAASKTRFSALESADENSASNASSIFSSTAMPAISMRASTAARGFSISSYSFCIESRSTSFCNTGLASLTVFNATLKYVATASGSVEEIVVLLFPEPRSSFWDAKCPK